MTASLLEVEPRLAQVVGVRASAAFGHAAVLPVLDVPDGPWRPPRPEDLGGRTLALVVLDGLVVRVHGARLLFGPCDRIEPWGGEGDWTACAGVRLAVIGDEYLRALRAWPTAAERLRVRRREPAPLVLGAVEHDERLLAPMLAILRQDEADVVVGSRYLAEGSLGDWSQGRRTISRVATGLSRLVLRGCHLTDPMSGFFMLKREMFDAAVRRLSQEGYKILLDILASSPVPARIKEVPYVFGLRRHGESKLDSLVVLDYVALLLDKLVGRWLPVRFLMFAAVGSIGVLLHMAVLAAAVHLGVPFLRAQIAATVIAIGGNFFLNNALTYRDKRLSGLGPVLLGLLSFYAVCSVGAVANVGIADFLFVKDYDWWVSGICGILVGAVWNYATSALFTWRK